MSTLSYTLFRQSAIDKRTILMAFSRMLEKLWVLEREYREGTNFTNFSIYIRFIRLFAQHLHLA